MPRGLSRWEWAGAWGSGSAFLGGPRDQGGTAGALGQALARGQEVGQAGSRNLPGDVSTVLGLVGGQSGFSVSSQVLWGNSGKALEAGPGAHVPPGREGPGRAHSAGGPEGGPGPDTGPQAWGDSAFPRWTSQRPHDGHFLSRLSLGGRRGPPGTSRTTTTARNVTLCHPDGCVSSLGSEQVK